MSSHPQSGYPQQPGYPQPGYPQQQPPFDPADLSKPLYGATIGQAFSRFWKKYTVFTGRASPSEFWWWYLIAALVSFVLSGINLVAVGFYAPPVTADLDPAQVFRDSMLHSLKASVASLVWSLVVLVGQLAISTRRLHDTGRSGWWYLIVFIPLVGIIVLIVFWAEAPKPEGQRYDR